MSDSETVRKTPMHGAHVACGGRMVDFAGWSLPVQFTGVIDEHRAVRERAGLFDVTHMGEVSVRGTGALGYLQELTTNDVSRLKPGRCHYSGLSNPRGAFVDDLLVYHLDENDYLLVINAANTAKDLAWMREHASRFNVQLADVSGEWAQIALQGPRARQILQPLVDATLDEIRYYRFRRMMLRGSSCIVSRTGYTGEDGFEIYAPWSAGDEIWNALLEAGREDGLVPAGLAARDTLRLEAKMALYGNDIDETTTALEADLAWIVKLEKGPFIGRDALLAQKEEGIQRKLIGFEMQGRAIARQGYAAWHDGREVGRVTSGTFAPFLQKRIGLVYLPIALTEPGTEFEIQIRQRREGAVVVTTPFYTRPDKRKP